MSTNEGWIAQHPVRATQISTETYLNLKQQHKSSLPHCIFSSHNMVLERTNDSQVQYEQKPMTKTKVVDVSIWYSRGKETTRIIKDDKYKQWNLQCLSNWVNHDLKSTKKNQAWKCNKSRLPHCIFSFHGLVQEGANDSKAQYHEKPMANGSENMKIKQSITNINNGIFSI
jgi:hypothetical protein